MVDDVLTTGKSEIQAKIKEMIMAQLEQQEIGLMLTEYHDAGLRAPDNRSDGGL